MWKSVSFLFIYCHFLLIFYLGNSHISGMGDVWIFIFFLNDDLFGLKPGVSKGKKSSKHA